MTRRNTVHPYAIVQH